jgi:aryl-alcohol dehydrogenase-like predicted oxidoreductase
MIFGPDSPKARPNRAVSRAIIERYIDEGGNFIDTADGYTNGRSEELIGDVISAARLRDKVVIATKFSYNVDPDNPNAGGNGRKNVYRAIEASLRRLKTDFIDVYWMHSWDTLTPVEEVLSTLDALVRAGKVRYIGFSNPPAWYAACAQTMAMMGGLEKIVALQLEYSLVERTIEHEHIPAAQALEMAICPWGSLANGFLTGKYRRNEEVTAASGRLGSLQNTTNPIFQEFTERNWGILEVVDRVAQEMDRPPAALALNWVITQPGVTSTVIGASDLQQLETALSALEFTIPADSRLLLDRVSSVPLGSPYIFFQKPLLPVYNGKARIRRWQRATLHREG